MKSDAGIQQLVKRAKSVRISVLNPQAEHLADYDRVALNNIMQAMEGELLIRAAPDRELMIRTAALVCVGNASRYEIHNDQEQAREAVKLARAIISAVDSEHTEDSTR